MAIRRSIRRPFQGRPSAIEALENRRLLSTVVFAVNAGGTSVTNHNGVVFQADSGFTGGVATNVPKSISGTDDDALYASYHQGSSFSFARKIANGTYTLQLSFSDEVVTAVGQRTFDVTAEDKRILHNFDIVANAGSSSAITKYFSVTVTDRHLSLGFKAVKGDALVSAIELRKGGPDVDWRWVDDPSAPMARYESAGATVNGKLYVFGGYINKQIQATARCDVFDPATDKWKRIADMPEALTHCGQAVHGTTVWLVGGFVGDNPGPGTRHVWKYNTLTNRWSRGLSLPKKRGAGACALVGDQLHFFGGLLHANSSTDPVKQDFGDHWVLDLANGGGWKSAAPMPNARNHLSGVAFNGLVYAIGGQHLWNEDHPISEVDQYDPSTDKWKKVASLPKPRSHMSASTFIMSNRILVGGGATSGFAALTDVDSYNPATNSWSHLYSLPEGRITPVAGSIDQQILVTTGSPKNLVASASTFRLIAAE